MTRLQNGQIFPDLTITTVDGRTLHTSEYLQGSFGVVLLYRGAWCPFCIAQLGGFQRAADKLAETRIKVVALSVDDEATTRETIAKNGIGFPVGHSADADAVAAVTGAYVNPEPHHLQTTGFVLAPDGTVINAVYSSLAIGRLVVEDVIGMVSYIKAHS